MSEKIVNNAFNSARSILLDEVIKFSRATDPFYLSHISSSNISKKFQKQEKEFFASARLTVEVRV